VLRDQRSHDQVRSLKIRPDHVVYLLCSVLVCSILLRMASWTGWDGAADDEQPPQTLGTRYDEVPDWWPYAAEFPQWHVWRGICGLVYARRPRTSPPVVVRGEGAVDLRDQIRRAEGLMT
jgi:hypothetical protein